VAGRTREASAGWPRTGKALLGGMVAHDGGRPSAANVARPDGYPVREGEAFMMVGTMAEGATSAHALPARSRCALGRRRSAVGIDREGLDGREGLEGRGWETCGGPSRPRWRSGIPPYLGNVRWG
jgi:hypothetical protein